MLCSKNDINQKFWTHFIFHKCNDVWPSKEPRRLRSRFIGIWKVCIHLVASFLISKVFYPLLFLTRTRRTTYIYHALWKNAQTFPITELQFFTCMNCIPSIRFHRQRALSITGNRGVVYRDQTIAARKTTLNVAPMHFTFAQRIFRQYLCEVS